MALVRTCSRFTGVTRAQLGRGRLSDGRACFRAGLGGRRCTGQPGGQHAVVVHHHGRPREALEAPEVSPDLRRVVHSPATQRCQIERKKEGAERVTVERRARGGMQLAAWDAQPTVTHV